MDWLNWAIRIATVLGGVMFLVCFVIGALTVFNAWRATLLLWQAKKKWLDLQRQPKGFQDKVRYEDQNNKDNT
jgi:hypothetical protein